MQIFRKVLKFPLNSLRFYIHLPKSNKPVIDQFMTETRPDGTLYPVGDNTLIRDVDDKYGLEDIRDYKTILNHLNETKQNYQLNDLIYFFRHLTQLSDDGVIDKTELTFNQDFKSLVKSVQFRLRSGEHERFPHIGSFAFCFKQLGVKDSEVWAELEKKILDDEYHPNFKESVFAVQGFTEMNRILSTQSPEKQIVRIDALYRKLERTIRLTIWEVNPVHYQKIVTSLAEVNRFDPETFSKLEQHILTNLSLDYQTQVMVDILVGFAKGGQGSADFYDSMQYVIFKGHMFNRNIFHQSRIEIQFDGRIVSGLMEIFQQAQKNFHTFQLHPNFQALVHRVLINSKTTYNLTSATRTLELLPSFQFEDSKEIVQHLYSRIHNFKGFINIDELIRFYQYIEKNAKTSDDIPYTILSQLESTFIKNMPHYSNESIAQFYQYLQFQQNPYHKFDRPNFICNNIELQESLWKFIDLKMNELDVDQITIYQTIFDRAIENVKTLEEVVEKPKPFWQSFLPVQKTQLKESKDFQAQYRITAKKLNDVRLVQKYQQQMKLQISHK